MRLFKNEYVTKCLIEHKYVQLDTNKAFGRVYQMPGYGTLKTNGFEHRFLFIHQGSGIYTHQHTSEIELYKRVSGDFYFPDGLCLLDESHQIDAVKSTSIIETFKYDASSLAIGIKDRQALNKILTRNLNEQFELLNNVITLLSNGFDFFEISRYYSLPIDTVKNIYDTYFISDFPIIQSNDQEVEKMIINRKKSV